MAKKKEIKENDENTNPVGTDPEDNRVNKLENQVGALSRIVDKMKAQFGMNDKGYSRPILLASIALVLGMVWISGAANWIARDIFNYWDTDGNIVCAGDITAGGAISVEDKYVAVGPDATTQLQVDRGTCTNGQASVLFTAAFSAAPSVVFGWKSDVSAYAATTNASIAATAVTVTNCVPKTIVAVGDLVDMYWIAIGSE